MTSDPMSPVNTCEPVEHLLIGGGMGSLGLEDSGQLARRDPPNASHRNFNPSSLANRSSDPRVVVALSGGSFSSLPLNSPLLRGFHHCHLGTDSSIVNHYISNDPDVLVESVEVGAYEHAGAVLLKRQL